MCLCSVWVYAYGRLLTHTLKSDYHGIKDVARNAGEFLAYVTGKIILYFLILINCIFCFYNYPFELMLISRM